MIGSRLIQRNNQKLTNYGTNHVIINYSFNYKLVGLTHLCPGGVTYSSWYQVKQNRKDRQYIDQIVDGKYFQIKTDKKINNGNDIRWTMKGAGWFTFTNTAVNGYKCEQYILKNDEKFLKESGTMTFLKTTTEMKIWFEGNLELCKDCLL